MCRAERGVETGVGTWRIGPRDSVTAHAVHDGYDGSYLHGDSLDDVARDPAAPAGVELRRLRVRMPCQVLDVLQSHILRQQVSYHQHPERVRPEPHRKPGRLQPGGGAAVYSP